MRADQITSHGRTGRVAARSIVSIGRISTIGELAGLVWREVIHLASAFAQTINLESEL